VLVLDLFRHLQTNAQRLNASRFAAMPLSTRRDEVVAMATPPAPR
jgi:hypothetical protein